MADEPDYAESDGNVVPIDRKNIDSQPNSQEIEYDDVDGDYYDEDINDGFIPSDFASKFNPAAGNGPSTAAPTKPSSTSTTTAKTTTTTKTTTTSKATTTSPKTSAPTTRSTVRPRTYPPSQTPPPRRPFGPFDEAFEPVRTGARTPVGQNGRTEVSRNDRIKPDAPLNVPNGPVYLAPQDNEIADSSNVKNNAPPNVNEPNNKIESDTQGYTPKLNLGNSVF